MVKSSGTGLLLEIGMTPIEAIMSEQKLLLECMGWQDKIGTLEAGKLADVVVSKNSIQY